MDERKKIVVTLGSNRGLTKLEFFLSRESLDIYRAGSPQAAKGYLEQVDADVVVVCWPLPDSRIVTLVEELRGAGGIAAEPAVVVLAEPETVADLAELDLGGAIVLATDERALALEETLGELLAQGARRAVRVLVKLTVDLEDAKLHRACQTMNLSHTGMALITRERLAVGRRSSFSFFLPEDDRPVEGEAEIVRHADREVEGFEGLGLRFLDLRADGRERLEEFLTARAEASWGPSSGAAGLASARG